MLLVKSASKGSVIYSSSGDYTSNQNVHTSSLHIPENPGFLTSGRQKYAAIEIFGAMVTC
jgi:hypothetical protein